MRELARRDSATREVRELALRLTRNALPYDEWAELEDLHRFVRDEIRYVRDIRDVETVQAPRYTLDVLAGDCDDKVTLLASLALAIGYPIRYVTIRTNPRRRELMTHVYLEAFCRRYGWTPMETTVPWAKLGEKAPAMGTPDVTEG
jgi:transglutaminase-like putative cysteine protease